MIRATVAALLLVAVLSACGGATHQVVPAVGHLPPSKAEQEYFAKFHATPAGAAVAHGVAAQRLAKRLRTVAVAHAAEVVSLRVYDLSARASLTPSVTIAVSQPARFLRDSLTAMLHALPDRYYLRVVDGEGHRVLEIWTPRRGRFGYDVVEKYTGCSNVTDEGLGMPPPCPGQ